MLQIKIQKMFSEATNKDQEILEFIPDYWITQENYNEVAEPAYPNNLVWCGMIRCSSKLN